MVVLFSVYCVRSCGVVGPSADVMCVLDATVDYCISFDPEQN